MGEFLDKISKYNVVNYLLPGALFAVLGEAISSYSFVQEDLLVGVFIYYFIGLVVSRIGSLLIEPAFRVLRFIKFVDYEDFLSASASDGKIEVLSEENNMYRTICALFVSLVALWLFETIAQHYPYLREISAPVLTLALLVLFAFAYRKQTQYMVLTS